VPKKEKINTKKKGQSPKSLLSKIKVAFKSERKRKKIIYFTVLGSVFLWLFWGLPLPTNLSSKQAVSTRILDRNGE